MAVSSNAFLTSPTAQHGVRATVAAAGSSIPVAPLQPAFEHRSFQTAEDSNQLKGLFGMTVSALAAATGVTVAASRRNRRSRQAAASRRNGVLVKASNDVEGSVCSVWLDRPDESRGNISNDLLAKTSATLMDKVQTLHGRDVRQCRKGAKQVATLGPATASEEKIEELFLCGVDVFRLNFSHGEYDEAVKLVQRIRNVENRYLHPIGILADLQGPKQRCGKFETDEGTDLKVGQKFRFDLDETLGNDVRVQLPHPEILIALKPGKLLLLDDGKIRLRVTRSGCTWQGNDMTVDENNPRPSDSTEDCPPFVECEVVVPGRLTARKGVNTPDVVLPISPITPKDRRDLEFACKVGVDWLALSFVQRHEDMEELRRLVEAAEGCNPRILAKIEKPAAVEELENILAASDGMMVARGDLGVEMNPEEVPFVQKEMVAKAQAAGKPVIVATQMLESMISNPAPTRAECSDVANAVFDGCDAVMLSGETSVGKFPAECVEIQRRVIVTSEENIASATSGARPGGYLPNLGANLAQEEVSDSNAVLASAAKLAGGTGAKAIIVFTATGRSIEMLVKQRPNVPIIAVCPCLETARWLSLYRGVYAMSDSESQELAVRVSKEGPYSARFTEGLEVACRLARDKGIATNEDDHLVVVARLPLFSWGPLNTIRLVSALGPKVADGYGPSEGEQD